MRIPSEMQSAEEWFNEAKELGYTVAETTLFCNVGDRFLAKTSEFEKDSGEFESEVEFTKGSAETWFKKAKKLGYTVIDVGERFLAKTETELVGSFERDSGECWLSKNEEVK